jgi:hypothetical protein
VIKWVVLALAFVLTCEAAAAGDALLVASLRDGRPPQTPKPNGEQLAQLCFKTGEQPAGVNKICFYNCAGSAAAIPVKAYDICTFNIEQ